MVLDMVEVLERDFRQTRELLLCQAGELPLPLCAHKVANGSTNEKFSGSYGLVEVNLSYILESIHDLCHVRESSGLENAHEALRPMWKGS